MILYTLVFWLGCVAIIAHADLQVVQSWKYLEYQYPDSDIEAEAIQNRNYIYQQNVPVDVDVAPGGRMFVTVERQAGVPSSLNTVTNISGDGGGNYLTPYPDWSWTSTYICDSIIGVFRITIDECNRLWVLDNGSVGDDAICPPKLLAFDLMSDTLILHINIPETLLASIHKLATVVVDAGEDCLMTKAYMADMVGNALLVWDGIHTFRIDSPFFGPDPNAVEFSVDGSDFLLVRGVMGLALTQDQINPMEQLLYFTSLSSYNMHYTNVPTVNLANSFHKPIQYFTEPTQLISQSTVHAFSSKGILFFNSVSNNSILCWNRHKPFTPENIVTVAQDDETLQWVSSTKIRPSDNGEMLWVMTDRYQQVETNTLDFDEVNFNVLASLVDDLVSGTNCEL